ncbi:MAG: hypothetical protein NTX95_08540 [Actinobacteria bacterium]|nr:hypothetical protein [Actinomycetota bacterium]
MDDREILLGNLLVDACAALDARQLDAFDAIVEQAGDDRQELLDMVEVALSLRGPVEPSPELVQQVAMTPMFDVRPWPEILETARLEASIKRPALLAQLAERLGIRDAEAQERLNERYHELETGQLEPARVQPALLDALGELLGGIRETLAATRFNPMPDLGPSAVLNRSGDVAYSMMLTDEAAFGPEPTTDAERMVDDLFGV